MSWLDDAIGLFTSIMKNGDGTLIRNTIKNANTEVLRSAMRTVASDPSVLRGIIQNADADTFARLARNLDDDTLINMAKNLDDDMLSTFLLNIDQDVARRIASALDPAVIQRISVTDPFFASHIGRSGTSAELVDMFRTAGNLTQEQAEALARGVPDALAKNADFLKNINTKGLNDPLRQSIETLRTSADDVTQQIRNAVKTEFGALDANKINQVAARTGRTAEEVEDIARQNGEIAKLLGANDGNVIVRGLKKFDDALGNPAQFVQQNWMKIGLGMMILCMAYDTNNPFTALDRALDDIKETIQELKELADAAARAAGNAAKGTFDFVAFITSNWWISLLCCLAVIGIGVAATLS